MPPQKYHDLHCFINILLCKDNKKLFCPACKKKVVYGNKIFEVMQHINIMHHIDTVKSTLNQQFITSKLGEQ